MAGSSINCSDGMGRRNTARDDEYCHSDSNSESFARACIQHVFVGAARCRADRPPTDRLDDPGVEFAVHGTGVWIDLFTGNWPDPIYISRRTAVGGLTSGSGPMIPIDAKFLNVL